MERKCKPGDGMRAKAGVSAAALAVAFALSGCGGSDTGTATDLMRLRSKEGPDEFAVLPPKPLESPENLNLLPPPTPGGSNRTDQRPLDDAIIALGGKPGVTNGVPAADAALYAQSTRLGKQADIRNQLASEDLELRRENRGRPLERLFGTNSYYRTYRDQSLDQTAELEHWRSRGLATPSAPPPQSKAERKK